MDDNVSRGSLVTCKVYFRNLGWFLREKNLTHQELLQKSPNELLRAEWVVWPLESRMGRKRCRSTTNRGL